MLNSTVAYDTTIFPEFNRAASRSMIYVHQEHASAASETSIWTDGIKQCVVLLLKNRTNHDCLFMHLGPESIDKFYDKLQPFVDFFLSRAGEKVGVLITSLLSYSREPLINALHKQGIHFLDPIAIETTEQLAVAFRPMTTEILCLNQTDNTVTIKTFEALRSLPMLVPPAHRDPDFFESVNELNIMYDKFATYKMIKANSNDEYFAKFEAFLDIPISIGEVKLSQDRINYLDNISLNMKAMPLFEEIFEKPEQLMILCDFIKRYIEKYSNFSEVKLFIGTSIKFIRIVLDQKEAGQDIPDELIFILIDHINDLLLNYAHWMPELSRIGPKLLEQTTKHAPSRLSMVSVSNFL